LSDTKQSTSGGIGFCGLLAIVFITLRLLNVIDWPWVWVLAPVWIPSGIGIILIMVALFIACRDVYKK